MKTGLFNKGLLNTGRLNIRRFNPGPEKVDARVLSRRLPGQCASGLGPVRLVFAFPWIAGPWIAAPWRVARRAIRPLGAWPGSGCPRREGVWDVQARLIDPGVGCLWITVPWTVRSRVARPGTARPGRLGLLIVWKRTTGLAVVRPGINRPRSCAVGPWVVVQRHRSTRLVIEMHRASNHSAANKTIRPRFARKKLPQWICP